MKKIIVLLIWIIISVPSACFSDEVILNPVDDTYILEYAPNDINGDMPIVMAGPNINNNDFITFIRFPIDEGYIQGIPEGSIITNAFLKMHRQNDNDPDLYSYRVNYPLDWSETTFYWNYPGGWEYYGPLATGVIHSGTSNHYQFESSAMTNLVNDWYDGIRQNGGFVIAATLNLGYYNIAGLFSKEVWDTTKWPELVIFYDPPSPPTAPTNLVAIFISPTQIDLTWEDNSNNEDHFRLERNYNSGGWELVGNIGANQEEFFQNPLPEGTYQYRIRAEMGSLYSDWAVSNMVNIPLGVNNDINNGNPVIFSLNPPYPNPFNPETTLNWSLPKSGEVSLTIFDIQGRVVARLIDGYQPAGSHEITWNAQNFTSGIYFARLTANDLTQTQKLLFIK